MKRAGIYKRVSKMTGVYGVDETYLTQLSPVEHMPVVEFEDELVVDLCLRKRSRVQDEQASEKQHQEVTGVDLQQVSCLSAHDWVIVIDLFCAVHQTLYSKDDASSC